MLSLFRQFAALLLLSAVFTGCGSGGSSGGGETAPADNSTLVAGKTYYSVSATEIGVIDLHEQGDATLTRTVVAEDRTEQVDGQWQLSASTLSVDFGSEHREFNVDANGDALIEGELQWQQIVTPTVQLLTGDFWMAPRDYDPVQHFEFNADGSGAVYFYLSDEPARAAMHWQIEDKTVVVNYDNLNANERFFIVGNPEPGHLSVIVFGGSLSSMYSYVASLIPFTLPNQTIATVDQIRGKHFHGQLGSEDHLLELRDDHSFHMTIIPVTGASFTESYEENGSWQIDDAGLLILDSDTGERQLMAKMSQVPFLQSGNYKYRVFDIVQNADIAGISWSAGSNGVAFWFDADGNGFARMGSVESGQKIPFTWEQQQDHIHLVVLGSQHLDWLVTLLDRKLGRLEIKQLTLGESSYTSLASMSFTREQLPAATAELVGDKRFYRLDDRKAEILQFSSSGWFDTQILDLQTDASSDDHGSWQIDTQGRITLAGEQLSRLLIASNISGSVFLTEDGASFYPLQATLVAGDLVGEWLAPGTDASMQLIVDGTGSIDGAISAPLDITWQIVGDYVHVEFGASPDLVYSWYLTAPTQAGQTASILQCKVSGDSCSDVEFLPFRRQ